MDSSLIQSRKLESPNTLIEDYFFPYCVNSSEVNRMRLIRSQQDLFGQESKIKSGLFVKLLLRRRIHARFDRLATNLHE